MEFSDSEEEVIDLNEEKDKLKDDKKMEKSKSKSSSSKNMKWVKSSLESISQMAKNEVEEIEYEENNIFNQEEENININNDNEGEDQEKLSDYDNYNDKENKNNYDDNYNKNNDFTEKTEETHADTNMSKNKQNFYTFIWDEGGENVKLIGSFSNWKQKYEMEALEKEVHMKEEQLTKEKKEELLIEKEIEKKKKEALSKLVEEPDIDNPDITTICFRYPDGERIKNRRFLKSHKIQNLYDFVASLGEEIYTEKENKSFSLFQPFPPKKYENMENTLEQENLVSNAVIQIREE